LVTLDAEYFINFIKDNDVFFKLDTNYRKSNRFIYLVTDFDTLKNKGFYEFENLVKTSKYNIRGRIIYKVRKTTEEESQVLKFKRSGQIYNPKEIQWSEHFLDGKTRPYTARYDSLEKKFKMTMKKKVTFKENSLNQPPLGL